MVSRVAVGTENREKTSLDTIVLTLPAFGRSAYCFQLAAKISRPDTLCYKPSINSWVLLNLLSIRGRAETISRGNPKRNALRPGRWCHRANHNSAMAYKGQGKDKCHSYTPKIWMSVDHSQQCGVTDFERQLYQQGRHSVAQWNFLRPTSTDRQGPKIPWALRSSILQVHHPLLLERFFVPSTCRPFGRTYPMNVP